MRSKAKWKRLVVALMSALLVGTMPGVSAWAESSENLIFHNESILNEKENEEEIVLNEERDTEEDISDATEGELGEAILSALSATQEKLAGVETTSTNVDGFIAPIETPDADAVKISTAADLKAMSLTGSYVLTADIDLSATEGWTPIGGALSAAFRGKLDGQGHTIRGLHAASTFDSGTILGPCYSVGLFGVCDGAEIKNIRFEEANVSVTTTSGYDYQTAITSEKCIYAGIVTGYAVGETVIYNCITDGAVLSKAYSEGYNPSIAGGLAGYCNSVVISYCQNSASVDGYNGNAVSAYDTNAGGLVGRFEGNGIIDKSCNMGAITGKTLDYGNSYAGGLIGLTSTTANIVVTDSYNRGAVHALSGNMFCDNAYAGGVSASFSGSVNRFYNSGEVIAQANDPYGIDNTQAYAGGICGGASSQTAISNSASIASQVSAKGSSVSSAYRICRQGSKVNNVSNSVMVTSSTNDADSLVDEDELLHADVYENRLGWDFFQTWSISDGDDYPALRQVDVSSDEFQAEYVRQHLDFVRDGRYADFVNKYRWSQTYWSEENNLGSNTAYVLYKVTDKAVDFLKLDFGSFFKDDNPYYAIVADYVDNHTTLKKVEELKTIVLPYKMEEIYKKVKNFFKKYWPNDNFDELTDEDLFFLLHYDPENSDQLLEPDFQDRLSEIVYGDRGEEFAEILGIGKKGTELFEAFLKKKDEINNQIEWINGLINYSAEVQSYVEANESFKIILGMMQENVPEPTNIHQLADKVRLKRALGEYTRYNDSTFWQAKAFASYLIDGKIGGIKKDFTDFVSDTVSDYLKENLSEEALSQYQIIKKVADKTWKIMEYVTKNGDLQLCRRALEGNALFERSMFITLDQVLDKFLMDKSYDNACLFDTAFNFFKETEQYSMDIVTQYMDTYQTSWFAAIKNHSNSFMNSAIEEVQVNKMQVYKTYCHGTQYQLGTKVITIACPTDVSIFDADGNVVAKVQGGQAISESPDALAFTSNAVKIFTLSGDQDYKLSIEATADGVMSYSVSEYADDLSNVQVVSYNNIQIQYGDSFEGNISAEMNVQPEMYNLTNAQTEEVVSDFTQATEQNFVPVSGLTLTADKTILAHDESIKYTANVFPENSSIQTVVWRSTDESVATVDEQGNVSAVGAGRTDIVVQPLTGGFEACETVVVLADGQTWCLTNQPRNSSYVLGESADSLTFGVYNPEMVPLEFAWFVSETGENGDFEELENATNFLIPPTDEVGTFFYYAEVTDGLLTERTDTAAITVYERNIVASGISEDCLVWELDDQEYLTISGEGAMADYENAEDVPWNAFAENIKKVSVEQGVTSLSKKAMAEMRGVQNIQLASSVQTIAEGSLTDCINLVELTVPFVGVSREAEGADAVLGAIFGKTSSEGTFQCSEIDGSSLRGYYYKIPTTLRKVVVTNASRILLGAFYGCSNLTEVVLGDGIASIAQYAFRNCSGLTELVIPDSVTSIEEYALIGCDGLQTLTVPFVGLSREADNDYDSALGAVFGRTNDGTTVQYCVFDGFSLSGYNFAIPNTLSCVKLTSEESISTGAFSNCVNLKEVYFSGDLGAVGLYAFYGCSGLTDVYYEDTDVRWREVDIDTGGNGNAPLTDATLHCIPTIRLVANSLSLTGNIGVNFYMELAEGILTDAGAKMLFTLPNGTSTDQMLSEARESTLGGRKCRVFTCEVASTQMTTEIRAKFVRGNGEESDETTYSVFAYASYILDHENENEKYAEAAPLVRAMLNYGGLAQKYFAYDKERLANRKLSAEEKALPEVTEEMLSPYAANVSGTAEGLRYYGSSLILKSETTIRHYFLLDEGHDISEYRFLLGEKELEPMASGAYYYISIPDIPSNQLDTMYSVEANGLSITYSALSYVKAKLGKQDTEESLANLLKGLYVYNREANVFFT